eukprot:12682662-Alexandrium_andersonii.AAC.1
MCFQRETDQHNRNDHPHRDAPLGRFLTRRLTPCATKRPARSTENGIRFRRSLAADSALPSLTC